MPRALRPYIEADIVVYDAGPMDLECPHCHALFWDTEKQSRSTQTRIVYGRCCNHGKIKLQMLRDVPDPLLRLFAGNTPEARHFRENIRRYNAAFAFTSMFSNIDQNVTGTGRRGGPYTFRIHGELYHRMGPLEPQNGGDASYAQLYIYDSEYANTARLNNPINQGLNGSIMDDLDQVMRTYHPYVTVYRSAYQQMLANPQDNQEENILHARIVLTAARDARTYNVPTADEIAVLLPTDPSLQSGQLYLSSIRLIKQSGQLHSISMLDAAYACLHYVLLFPRGELGFYPHMPQGNRSVADMEARQERINARQPRGRVEHITQQDYFAF